MYHIFNDCFAGYVQCYNKKYNRKGSLFQSSLQHKAVQNDNYLLHLAAYIHRNPVKASLASSAAKWEFSDFPPSQEILNQLAIGWNLENYSIFVRNYPEEIENMIENYLFNPGAE